MNKCSYNNDNKSNKKPFQSNRQTSDKYVQNFVDFNRILDSNKNQNQKSNPTNSPASLALTNSYAALFDNNPNKYL